MKKVLIIYSIIAGMGLHAWGIDDNPPLAIGLITGSVIDATSREEKFTLYPSVFLTYAPGGKNQFQLSYSRRVDRPSIGQVNPIRSWSTPLLTMVGNPGLKPQFTDSYEINYTRRLKKGSISLGTFFRRINDNIIRYASTDPFDENKVVLTFVNADYEDRYGVEMSG